jgi:hypothetical protein
MVEDRKRPMFVALSIIALAAIIGRSITCGETLDFPGTTA